MRVGAGGRLTERGDGRGMTLEKLGVEPITREFFFLHCPPTLECVAFGSRGSRGEGASVDSRLAV